MRHVMGKVGRVVAALALACAFCAVPTGCHCKRCDKTPCPCKEQKQTNEGQQQHKP